MPSARLLGAMTTVDIDSLLAQDDVRALLESSEQAGTIRLLELADLVEAHELAGSSRMPSCGSSTSVESRSSTRRPRRSLPHTSHP